jgi:integrase
VARGSIRYTGHSWQITYDAPLDASGRRRQKRQAGFRTRREAEKGLSAALAAVASGSWAESSRLTVGEHLAEWLARQESRLTWTTYRSYQSIVRAHLGPALGRLVLSKLTAREIDHYLDAKRGCGLAEKTLRRHFAVLGAALKQAERWGRIDRNPCALAEAPSGKSEKRIPLTGEELGELLAALEGDWLRLPVLLAVGTGMRLGEVCGLRWMDVRLDQRLLTLQQSLSAFRDGVPVFTACKTEQSQRRIPLPPFLLSALIQYRGEQAAWKLAHADVWRESGLVLTNEIGEARRPDVVSHKFTKVRKSLGLVATFHDLRHLHASTLLLANIHPKMVQAQMGHSSVKVSMDQYSHLLPGAGESEIAATVEAGLGRLLKGVG